MSQVTTQTSGASNSAVDHSLKEVLAFRLGDEEYAINILSVQEIRGFEKPTHIANAPDYLLGVINLRGAIVPVVDLRIRFGNNEPIYSDFTVVIIINVYDKVIGIVVDAVSDVIMIGQEDIKPAPEFGSAIHTEYLSGLCTLGERMLILVKIEQLIMGKDLALFENVHAEDFA